MNISVILAHPDCKSFNHAIACVMANAAYQTGMRTTFDEKTQEVMAGGKVFKY